MAKKQKKYIFIYWRGHPPLNLEKEMTYLRTSHEEEITELNRRLHQQEEELECLRRKTVTTSTGSDPFIQNMEREVPLLSEGCANLEEGIVKVKADMEIMATDITNLHSKLEQVTTARPVGLSEDATDRNEDSSGVVQAGDELGSANLETMDRKLKDLTGSTKKAHRRLHLEGESRDQYSRRDTLLISGVTYKPGEDTTQLAVRIAHTLGVRISPSDISVSHRSGRRAGGNPRPIMVKFVRRDVKNLILANRKLAGNIKADDDGKHVRIFLDEALTSMRAKVCKRLRADKISHFTRDGKVFIAMGPNESGEPDFKVHDSPQDWEALDWSDSFKTELGIYP